MAIVLFLMYFLQGLGYWFVQKVLKKKLISWLTAVHALILIGSYVYYWLFTGHYAFLVENSNPMFNDSFQNLNITLTILTLLIFCIGIPAYITNLLIGIFRKAK